MCTPMPSSGEREAGDSNEHHVPPPSTVAHPISARLRMNQPSSAGTRPVSVSSILASCIMRRAYGTMPPMGGATLTLRPLAHGDEAELRRIHAAPEVARWWEAPADAFPWYDDDESVRFVIDVDGQVAGMIQYWEEPDPKSRHASIDLFVDPA